MTTAAQIHPAARPALEALGILDAHGDTALTAPVIAATLAEKLDVLARFSGLTGRDWTVYQVPALGPAWVVRWDRAAIALASPSEVAYVERILAERTAGRTWLRRRVYAVVDALGLRDSRYARPAR